MYTEFLVADLVLIETQEYCCINEGAPPLYHIKHSSRDRKSETKTRNAYRERKKKNHLHVLSHTPEACLPHLVLRLVRDHNGDFVQFRCHLHLTRESRRLCDGRSEVEHVHLILARRAWQLRVRRGVEDDVASAAGAGAITRRLHVHASHVTYHLHQCESDRCFYCSNFMLDTTLDVHLHLTRRGR